ncbi:YdcF family protein [bacterium]|nr:YdcF family protein [bacterium]
MHRTYFEMAIKCPKVKKALLCICVSTAMVITILVGARLWVHISTRNQVRTHIAAMPHGKIALVLGAKVHKNGKPATLLADRLNTAIRLYQAGRVDKLLMSGDNRFTHYNEPQRMRDYAVSHGVAPDDVVMDFAGRRTYDSIYRAKHIFGLSSIVIVSQRSHVERALFISKRIGIDACGVPADVKSHWNARMSFRELPACFSAVIDVYVRHPKPVMGRKERI